MPQGGACSPFEDPACGGAEAEVFWAPEDNRSAVRVIVKRARAPDEDDSIELRRLRCRKSLLITPDGLQHLVLSRGDLSVQLICEGRSLLENEIFLQVQVGGLSRLDGGISSLIALRAIMKDARSRSQRAPRPQFLRLRDSLIALDGSLAGASYREIAAVLHGEEEAASAWRSASRFLKDKVRRDVKRGRSLMEGGYRRLLK